MSIFTKASEWLSKVKVPPFITRINKRIWWIIGVIVLLLIAGGGYTIYNSATSASSATATAPLQTAVVRQGNLVIYASGNGTLVAAKQASFSFGTSGQIAKVNAKTGDVVHAGDILAELDNSTQQIQYTQAKRAIDDMTSPYAVATAQLAIATSLKTVDTSRSTLTFLISPLVMSYENLEATAEQTLADAQAAAAQSPSAEADKKVKQAQTTLQYYKDKIVGSNLYYVKYYLPKFFTKIDRLHRTKTVYPPSPADIANARATLAQAKASVIENRNYLAAITGKAIPDGATGSNLTAFENAQLALKTAEANLAATQLIAPISGTLMTFNLTVGNKADSTTTITIADLSQPFIQAYLDPADWNKVKVGKDAEITFDALPGSKFTGKVTEVDPGLYASGNTSVISALVAVDIPKEGFDLPLGSTASIDVIGGRADNALLIPVEALHPAGNLYTVFVMENGKPNLHVVQIGIQDLVSVEIKSGLKAGDVVTTGITGTKAQ